MIEAYAEDLAYIHDVGHGDFAVRSAPGLLDILRDAGIESGTVVDLGCGSGLWARELVAAGYQVLGVDISSAMIDIARSRVPDAHFRVGSFLEAELPRCKAITAIGEIFNYLFDANNDLAALVRIFVRAHEALEAGGVLIFDVAEPGRGGGPGVRQKHREGEDWAVLVDMEEDKSQAILTRRITSFRKVGDLYRRGYEVHRLHLYRGKDLAEALRRVGFRVRLVRSYGTFPLPLGLVGIVARKPLAKTSIL